MKSLIDVKNIVKNRAKYQKVLLLYDDSVSNIEIKDIYELIKSDCIFNQMNIKCIDENELMNGYRLIIYYMSGDGFLKLTFNRDEFINIFIPTNNQILPFLLDENFKLSKNKHYLIAENNKVDLSMLTSLYFNRVYNYIFNTIYNVSKKIECTKIDINKFNLNFLDVLNELDFDNEFFDFKIIKQTDLKLSDLAFLNLILLNAFELFLISIRNKSLSMVDVYKIAHNDNKKINTYYEMMNNYTLLEVLNLNYNCIVNMIKTSKEFILEILEYEYQEFNIDNILRNICRYASEDEGLFGYMYFYNILSV